MTLPSYVKTKAEIVPFEDIFLSLLRTAFPDIPILTLIPEKPMYPMVLISRARLEGYWNGDPRWLDEGGLQVNVFVQGTERYSDGAVLCEAIRIAITEKWLAGWEYPGYGSIRNLAMVEEPASEADWAISEGPVQKADLPPDVARFRMTFQLQMRRNKTSIRR